MTKADRRALACVVLGGCKVKRFNSARVVVDKDHPNFSGWYWMVPGGTQWIGSFKTMRSCVEDARQALEGVNNKR